MKRALFVILLLPVALEAQKPMRYRIESKVVSAMDMAGMLAGMLPNMPDDARDEMAGMTAGLAEPPSSTVALLSITIRDSAGGKVVHAVIDSVVTNQFAGIKELKSTVPSAMMAMIGSGKGGTIDFFSLNGVQSAQRSSPQMNVEVSQVMSLIPFLLPVFPANAKVGSAWTDTASAALRPAAQLTPGVSQTQGRPLTTAWRWSSADSLDAVMDGDESMKVGTMIASTMLTSGKQHYTIDATRGVRDGTIERVSTTGSSMGGGSGLTVAMKVTQTVRISRIQE